MQETRVYKLELRDMQESSNEGKLSGYATVFRELNPYYSEVIDAGSFDKTLQESGGCVPLEADHADWIGMTTVASADRKGIAFEAVYDFNVQAARENWSLASLAYRLKRPAGLSQTFECIKDIVKDGIRHIKELRWLAVSVCRPGFQSLGSAQVTQMRSNGQLYNRHNGLWQPSEHETAAPIAEPLNSTRINAALDGLLKDLRAR